MKPAVTANTDFVLDLFTRLSAERPADNLFFSPYSVSIALAMVAEGARGETAEQMGRVLRFPEAIRNTGGDSATRPWNIESIHTGLAALNDRFNGADRPNLTSIREKIRILRRQLDLANNEAERLQNAGKWEEVHDAIVNAHRIANELNELLPLVDQYELRIANALWGEKTYPFQQSYIDTISRFYKTGGIFPLDFQHNYGPSIDRINAWVAEQTNQRIRNLIPKDALSENERSLLSLVLTNAVYFRGEWSEIFVATETKPDDFLLATGAKVSVPMMHHGEMHKTRYAAFNPDGSFFATPREQSSDRSDLTTLYPPARGFTILELPYKGDDLAMVVIVPRSAGGLPAIEKQLTSSSLNAWLGKLEQRDVDVYMPRFRLATNYSMSRTLQAMGITRAFEPTGAQFDGMCASQDPRLKVFISQVVHKAFVEVTEKGTEAAAATAMEMLGALLPEMLPFNPTFRADKPFLFLIRDVKSGTILFLGRMTGPAPSNDK